MKNLLLLKVDIGIRLPSLKIGKFKFLEIVGLFHRFVHVYESNLNNLSDSP